MSVSSMLARNSAVMPPGRRDRKMPRRTKAPAISPIRLIAGCRPPSTGTARTTDTARLRWLGLPHDDHLEVVARHDQRAVGRLVEAVEQGAQVVLERLAPLALERAERLEHRTV